MLAAMLLLIAYNVYYQWRYEDYLAEQERIAQQSVAMEDREKQSDGQKGATRPDIALAPGFEAPVSAAPTESAFLPESEASEEIAPTLPLEPATGIQTNDTAEKQLVVDNGLTKIVLTNRGASPISYILKSYHDYEMENINLYFDYEKRVKKLAEEGSGSILKKAKVYPLLGLVFPREAFSDKINNAYFSTQEERTEVEVMNRPYTITYRLVDSSGVEITKTYIFQPNSYQFEFSVSVKSSPEWGDFNYQLTWFGLGDEEVEGRAAYVYIGPVVMENGKKRKDAPDDENLTEVYSGDILWAGLSNRYYAALGIPEYPEDQKVFARYLDDENFSVNWRLTATPGGKQENFRFFVGPKLHNVLEEYDRAIYSVIDYGFLDIIAKPLFWTMRYFHGWTDNWGWAIILLTILVKVIFFPLTQKSFKSMQKLQKVQPHLKKIQELYKDDKEKLNAALIALYKEHKVNPLGGCLPILLQIPIFFSLYTVLAESIELKGAGWALWITDLGQRDPYYITPVLMGATMLIQQIMTPSTGDPFQRKMMMALPVVFTFLFLSFPAGLVLYWLVNNILTIIQQWVIRRQDT